MPYVITTRREGPYWGPENVISQSRRAVATLEEARSAAVNAWYAAEPGDRDEHALARRDACLRLPEAGGTIGPLPDGTVIEVEWQAWSVLKAQTRLDSPLVADYTTREIIDAFNAQSSR